MNQQRIDFAVRTAIWLSIWGLCVYLRKPAGSGLMPERFGAVNFVGTALIALGFALYCWAAVVMTRAVPKAGVPPAELLACGPYRHVRHPIYLAGFLVFVGVLAFYAPVRMSDFVVVVLAALLVHFAVVRFEEPATRQRLGTAYDHYCAQVPRWIPRLSPATL